MVRLATMGAVLATAALLASPGAEACERHAAAPTSSAPAPAPAPAAASKSHGHGAPLAPRTHEELVQAGQKLLTAKCSCDSKADCTCKKGQCKCAKCKGRHDVLEALQQQGGEPPADSLARNDATAGVLL